MMKLLHTADIHLGTKNSQLANEKQKIVREEQSLLVKELLSEAKSDFDSALICGDLFHTKNITNKMKVNFFEGVKSFGKPVIYISGNHDEYVIGDDVPENFVVLSKNNPIYDLGDCRFYFANTQSVRENFDKSKKNILLVHGELKNKSDNDFVDLEFLRDFSFDYIAMGHLHTFDVVKLYGQELVYSGSLFSNGFDECGDKGYVEVEIDKKTTYKFVPFAKRRYMIENCDITGVKDSRQIEERIRQKLGDDKVSKNDIIRLLLSGYYDENLEKNIEIIEEKFNDYFAFNIIDKSKLNINIDKYKNEKLSFKAEFINLVENSDEGDEIKNTICKLGIEALKGEDLSI